MDPVSLIVAALAAGAVAGAQSTAADVVKDAYAGLKALVRRRFAGRESGEMVLEKHEGHPEAWRGALEAELVEVDVAGDSAVVQAAQQVLALLDAEGFRAGKYQVDARGAQGVQIGDQTTMTNTFTTPPSV
ncbi:MAG: RIP homotypic interaction motif-containing protein [Sciscionella sp.]